jgi:Cu2+-exporting ATPase
MNDRADPALFACFHCGLPADGAAGAGTWRIAFDGAEHPVCCPGCQAVARSIIDNGMGDFYRQRSGYSVPAPLPPVRPARPEHPARPAGGEGEQAILSVEAIRCAACGWLIERQLASQPGVVDVDLNLATCLLRVRWESGANDLDGVVASLAAIGYPAYPYDAGRHGARLERERKRMFKRLFVAGLAMMQVMMYAFPVYLASGGADGDMDADMRALLQWASFCLTLPALLYSAQPIWRGAWRSLGARAPGMDVPVALGIGAAFAASTVSLLRGHGDVYFDAVTMFIFLLLGSQYLELRARCAAAAQLQRLHQAAPATALRLDGYPARRMPASVAAADLRAGDYVLVAPGEAAAADGVVVEGASHVVLALLTGEALPQAVAAGDAVPGGAVNSSQPIVLRISRPAGQSTLARLAALVEGAGQGKPAIALWADRVGAWFVSALLVLALLTFAAWYPLSPARAWQVAVAVLVVSCPCALSLATPAALAAATGRLLRDGVLVVRPHVLETLARATHVVFDKTGTLTHGAPVLVALHASGRLDGQACLAIAAALEGASMHPLAAALKNAASGPALLARHLVQHAGAGVEGVVDGVAYRLGSAAFVGAPDDSVDDGATSVYLARSADPAGLLARFSLRDGLRADAAATVRALRQRGVAVSILSGDAASAVQAVALALGIDDWHAGLLPEQKLAAVRALQAGGAVVAMVGDGLNDAAVLAAADVSFAMGKGSDLACLHADCVLMRDSLDSLRQCADSARATMRVIRQNLAWAMLYNACAIPAAAAGLLSPWMAAAGMSCSSALVVLNALRLRRGP